MAEAPSGRPQGQLDRVLGDLTIGLHQAVARKHRVLADGRLGEYEQQVHVALAGDASTSYGYVDQPISFEFPFVWAPGQRRIPFATPHFTYGIEMTTPTAIFIHINAQVQSWSYDPHNFIVGATVRFAVIAPAAAVSVPYNAIAHLSFQGFAAYSEEDEFLGGGDPIAPSDGDVVGGAPINVVLPVVS